MTLAHQTGRRGAVANRPDIPAATAALLENWLSLRLPADGLAWLRDRVTAIADGAPVRAFFTAFSAVPRMTGKADLGLMPEDLATARQARPGWNPIAWSIDQAARAYLLLALPARDASGYQQALDLLFSAADVRERVTLLQSLPLLPHASLHRERAAEGVRSSIDAVFNAIALNNPYPAEQCDEAGWNQMVLKAFFIGSPVQAIQHLETRANPNLSRMLVDYARERHAAGRPVSPDLWRLVALHADDTALADLAAMLNGSNPKDQMIAALALSECPHPDARTLLATHPRLANQVASEQVDWGRLREG